jgi:hypothetical protein
MMCRWLPDPDGARRSMNETPVRYVVAAALLVNAVVGHYLFRTFLSNAGRQPVIGATLIATVVAMVAIAIALQPTHLTLQLARGSAVGFLLCVALFGFIVFISANTGSGLSSSDLLSEIAQLAGLALAQVVILVGSARIERLTAVELLASAISGTFQFWAVMVVLGLVSSPFE